MLARLRRRLTFANVCSFLALTVALGTGGAYAADSIGSGDVIDGSLVSADIKDGEVKAADIGSGQVYGSKILNGTVTSADLTNDNVAGVDIKNGTITNSDLERPSPWNFVGDSKCQHVAPSEATWCPVFAPGWSNYDSQRVFGQSGRYAQASYYRDLNGVVHLRGLVKGGTPGTGQGSWVFCLPEGFRPATTRAFVTVSNNALGRVNVRPDGFLQVEVGSSNWVSLDGLSFRTADTDADQVPQG